MTAFARIEALIVQRSYMGASKFANTQSLINALRQSSGPLSAARLTAQGVVRGFKSKLEGTAPPVLGALSSVNMTHCIDNGLYAA
jgi:hypothetical protein